MKKHYRQLPYGGNLCKVHFVGNVAQVTKRKGSKARTILAHI